MIRNNQIAFNEKIIWSHFDTGTNGDVLSKAQHAQGLQLVYVPTQQADVRTSLLTAARNPLGKKAAYGP